MRKSKQRKYREEYIEILTFVADNNNADGNFDVTLIAELIDSEYLKGGIARDEQGKVFHAQCYGITVSGRLFLEELREKARKEKASYKVLIIVYPIIGYIVGVISPVLSEWVKSLFK